MENAKGRGFLKAIGILLIIGGIIGVVSGVLAYVSSNAIESLVDSGTLDSTVATAVLTGSTLMLYCIFALVSGILEFIAGILGVKYANSPEKAMICIVFGIILIILTIISNFIDFSLLSIIIGLVLPVLYLIGGILNKKSVAE